MDEVNITIIGAGVIGLSIAAELSKNYEDIVVLEQHKKNGQETSSRNSEVIHAGIYYTEGSLKSHLCIRGNRLLYDYCEKHKINHRKTTKLIVSTNEEEEKQLEKIIKNANRCGVDGLSIISKDDVKKLEPEVNATAAILSATTGILDAHGLMDALENEAKTSGCMFSYLSEVTGIEMVKNGYIIEVNNEYDFLSRIVINCAGLECATIADMAGFDIKKCGYTIYPCKGEYYYLKRKTNVKRLIYPVPMKDHTGLGTHITLDLSNRVKFGPNAYYVDSIDYHIDDTYHREFFDAGRKLLPFIEYDDIVPDMTGIRPKIQGENDPVKDFIIKDEAEACYPGFINLIGIESPGLTSCLAIGEYVNKIVKERI